MSVILKEVVDLTTSSALSSSSGLPQVALAVVQGIQAVGIHDVGAELDDHAIRDIHNDGTGDHTQDDGGGVDCSTGGNSANEYDGVASCN